MSGLIVAAIVALITAVFRDEGADSVFGLLLFVVLVPSGTLVTGIGVPLLVAEFIGRDADYFVLIALAVNFILFLACVFGFFMFGSKGFFSVVAVILIVVAIGNFAVVSS